MRKRQKPQTTSVKSGQSPQASKSVKKAGCGCGKKRRAR